MNKLSSEVKYLVTMGIYSIYELNDGRFILYTPPTQPGALFSHPLRIWELTAEGDVLGELKDGDLRNYDVKKVVDMVSRS